MGSLKMSWSKSTRIKVMIAIDTFFFLTELIVGFYAHSLALTADAFHMLNDIISLIIGLWAVVASQKATTDEFTFGWVRAEILGAFFNAVFLIALCVSIILEAITRLVEPPEIKDPWLILIVGCAGLFSNLVGFVVLGGHGHAHGPGGHDHDHGHSHDEHAGHEHVHGQSHDEEQGLERPLETEAADERGSIGGVLPEVVVRRATKGRQSTAEARDTPKRIRFGNGDSSSKDDGVDGASHRTSLHSRDRGRRRSSRSHSRLASFDEMSIHPQSFRQDIIAAVSSPAAGDSESEENDEIAEDATESSPLLDKNGSSHGTLNAPSHSHTKRARRDSSVHAGHNHTLPPKKSKGGHGHSHGDMGMNAMVLHVIGDALGNLGVIVSALIIWKTNWPGKEYADPLVSLVITAIILKTAIPLTSATSKVLLQAAPEHISVPDIRQDIEALPGVVSCHHIHVWQLSDTKIVASMHIQVTFPIDSDCGEKYMELAKRARKCLHAFGIHSATIQPEFCLDAERYQAIAGNSFQGVADAAGGPKSDACLLECIDDCEVPGCCSVQGQSSRDSSVRRGSGSSHSHNGHTH
ncbi:zinc homeostasis factor 1 [Emericellopsis cladophorae]|uniref:Zinc homeostasis factor 1 n=1 Tax=Emericellopsis cladophorae TaxID=2686198 RepID=A0A9P9Y4T8_9HYPO|nr:zinc homeostasis factor 1 [Emericellopsis cladophorae]KAI6783113.1 zinc homeostasis factor 1 [Emericellopsis cladophorae]